MQSGVLDNYRVPEIAQEAFRSGKYRSAQIDDGVSVFSGHDSGVAYRFFTHYEYNKTKSKLTGIEHCDSFDMIEWLVDRKLKPTERVRFIGDELLAFNDEGECIGGKYAEAYRRFKQGLEAPGLPLNKWDAVNPGHIEILANNGIFSVQQLAAADRQKIRAKFSPEFEEILDRAIQYVNGLTAREESNRHAEELLKVHQENSKLRDEMVALREQMKALNLGSGLSNAPVRRKRRTKAEMEAAAG